MSLLPFLLGDLDDQYDWIRPSRLCDQHFGVGITERDLLTPLVLPRSSRRLARLSSCPYYRPWKTRAAEKDEGSIVKFDKDKFQVNLDVQQFTPEEITVKATDENTITVEGKHEEKQDEHGFISRHFIRRYKLPKGHDISKTASHLSSDGILTISAPKIESEESKHREIPVIQTGKPSQALTEKASKQVENGDEEMMECEKPETKRRRK